jgi:hypothetical protein
MRVDSSQALVRLGKLELRIWGRHGVGTSYGTDRKGEQDTHEDLRERMFRKDRGWRLVPL